MQDYKSRKKHFQIGHSNVTEYLIRFLSADVKSHNQYSLSPPDEI